MSIIFKREWAMPNSLTFTIRPIKEIVERYVSGADVIVDPFANSCKYGTITNDLNPEFDTDYHLDALDFLKLLDSNSTDLVLYDPPYSLRQISEVYKGFGISGFDGRASWRANHLDEIKRIVRPGGVVLCFGWNSNGVGKKRGFEMLELLLVPHGGSKNDTIVTVERKTQDTLF